MKKILGFKLIHARDRSLAGEDFFSIFLLSLYFASFWKKGRRDKRSCDSHYVSTHQPSFLRWVITFSIKDVLFFSGRSDGPNQLCINKLDAHELTWKLLSLYISLESSRWARIEMVHKSYPFQVIYSGSDLNFSAKQTRYKSWIFLLFFFIQPLHQFERECEDLIFRYDRHNMDMPWTRGTQFYIYRMKYQTQYCTNVFPFLK